MLDDLGESFRTAMRRFASTVAVISVGHNARRHGMTATAVVSVSFDPPSLLICINRRTRIFEFLESHERFCVNMLHSEHIPVSRVFSEAKSLERFRQGDWQANERGIPYLRDAQAAIFCVKALSIPYGSHNVYFGNVEDVSTREEIAPLLYQNGDYGVFKTVGQADESSPRELLGWG